MGGGKKQKAPAAPDYASLQQSDAIANRETANELTKWNRPTQTDPFGNQINWTQDANGNWTQSQTMNPFFQQAQESGLWAYLNSAGQAANQGAFQAPTHAMSENRYWEALRNGDFQAPGSNLGYFNPVAGEIGNFDRTQGDKVASDMFESSMSRLRPEMARTKESLDVKLRQQGLQPGTEAYNRAMQNEMTSQGDVTAKLGLDATSAGYGAARDIYNTNLAGQGQRFGQALSGFQANLGKEQQAYEQALGAYGANTAQDWKAFDAASQEQDKRFAQDMAAYNLPMERAQAASQLFANAPKPYFPGFSGATGYSPADMSGAAQAQYQAKMGGYNAGQGKKNNLMGTAGNLGAAYMMSSSDETLKENIVPLEGKEALDAVLRLGGYEYDWRDGSGHDMGVIAQEVQKVLPELIGKAEAGTLMVNYTGLVALLMESVKYLARRAA